jgi:hypothetical protein
MSETSIEPPQTSSASYIEKWKLSEWLMAFLASAIVVIAFALIGFIIPIGKIEAIGVTNHNFLRGLSCIVFMIVIGMALSRYKKRNILKVLIPSLVGYVLLSSILTQIEIAPLSYEGSIEDIQEFNQGQTVLGVFIIFILSIPAGLGRWKLFFRLVMLPLLPLWLALRVIFFLMGASGGSSGSSESLGEAVNRHNQNSMTDNLMNNK